MPQLHAALLASRRPLRVARCALLAAAVGCAAAPTAPRTPAPSSPVSETQQAAGHPPVAVLVREGDPSAAIAVAALTEGIDPSRNAEVAVTLAAVVEARLAAAGIPGARVAAGTDGIRARALAPSGAGGQALVSAFRAALLLPVTATGPEMAAVARKRTALSHRPLPDPALRDAAQCAGEPYAAESSRSGVEDPPLEAATVEKWRASAFGLGRVVFGAVGPREEALALAAAVGGGPAWPAATAVTPDRTGRAASEELRVYDATPDLSPGAARVTLTLRTASAERAAAAAETLGDASGALVARLRAFDPDARVRDVTATAHVGDGCLRVTVYLPPPSATADPPAALAAAIHVVREQMRIDVADARIASASARRLANRAGDPRDAAERAAFWTLMLGAAPASPEGSSGAVDVAVGLSSANTAASVALADRAKAIHVELDRARDGGGDPIAEVRPRLERGQSELWVLLASPCGTESETASDAGSGAVAAIAAAESARDEARGTGADAEGWAAPDGVGVVAHAAALPGETPDALARRVAGLAARAFGASRLEPRDIARARARLLADGTSSDDARGFAVLADALAPGRPSWIVPFGTTASLEHASDAVVRARFDALRAGPLRVAVIANQDASQIDVAKETVEQWIARLPGSSRACPPSSPLPAPRLGTYALERPGAPSAEAWLAFALPSSSAEDRAVADVVAAAFDGEGGLLEKALGPGLARSWGARVTGTPRAPALVVRVSSAQGSLDAAVAETRALFDRVRQGAFSDADRARALARLADERLAASLEPKARLVALWRGEAPSALPSLDAIRAFAAKTLKDDALVIVASRPPRISPKTP